MQVEFLSDGHLNTSGRYRGQYFNRAVLVDSKWVVMNVKTTSTVLDYDTYKTCGNIQALTWTVNSAGYVYNSKEAIYMHHVMMPSMPPSKLSVDHVNQIKTDNRKCNLRLATQSQQNSNRAQRSDKIAPCPELVERGIKRLPRGIRYDNGMQRYVIEPFNMNGTRSTKMDHVGKFKDALAIYISESEKANTISIACQGNKLAQEFHAIMDAAIKFDSSIQKPVNDDIVVDDLSYARQLMEMLQDVQVQKGPANIEWSDIRNPNGVADTVGRIKGDTFTLYDAKMHHVLGDLNWETSGNVPRYKKQSLCSYIWTDLLKKDIPEGHIVAQISCDGYDVRSSNLYLLNRTMAFRTTPGEWIIPENVDIGMRFLPRGIVVNKSKVMITQAGKLIPGEFGANDDGLWIKTRNKTNTEALIKSAIAVLKATHGADEFHAQNETYQWHMQTYRQAMQIA